MQLESNNEESFRFLSEHFVIFENAKDFVRFDENKGWRMLLFCLDGRFQIEVNGTPYTIEPNDIAFCTPDKIAAHTMMSPDFKGYLACCSANFSKRIFPNSADLWNKVFYMNRNFKIHLSDKEAAELLEDYHFLKRKIVHIDHLYYDEVMRCLLQAFLYQTAHVLSNHIAAETAPAEEPLQSRHQICQAFIDLLSSTKPVPRSVQWYADRLCKTPRYLSTAVKRASGKTASEWIHEALTREVADALKNSAKSIKEISDELEFPNLSFFGRYCRQRLGCSPSEFRQQKNKG
ncbi:helix-turn-helix domain-containing protein [Bacteroides sp. f07]|uniref:helix-turn-helix domain-containing protein n=1 Tax=Bacteroides sp. f07 TaxID=3132704 RepID=UPI0034A86AF1